MKMIRKSENDIIGGTKIRFGSIVFDANAKRVERLVEKCLQHVATDGTGWDELFYCRKYDSYWEKVFLNSAIHGGGAPSLLRISYEMAVEKYGETVKSFHQSMQ